MKLSKLKEVIDAAVEYAGGIDLDIIIYCEDLGSAFQIKSIAQGQILPELSIELSELDDDDDYDDDDDRFY